MPIEGRHTHDPDNTMARTFDGTLHGSAMFLTKLLRLPILDPGRIPLKEARPTQGFEGTRPLNPAADSPTVRIQPLTLRTATRPRNNTDPHWQDPNHSSPYLHSSGRQTSGTARSSVRLQAGAPPYHPCTASHLLQMTLSR